MHILKGTVWEDGAFRFFKFHASSKNFKTVMTQSYVHFPKK